MSVIFLPATLGLDLLNGRANFMGARDLKTPLPIKFLLLGGGGFWAFLEGGGWKCQFYFYGRSFFLNIRPTGSNLTAFILTGFAC